MPPIPSSVTSLFDASISLISASSRSRPMNEFSCCVRLFGVPFKRSQRGEIGAQLRVQQLEDVLGTRQVA